MPLSDFLVAELSARHEPTSDEGRAALVAAARPYVSQIGAPVLAALITRRIAELAGLSEAQIAPIVQAPMRPRMSDDASERRRDDLGDDHRARDPAFRPRAGSRLPVRRAPSLARQLLQAVLLQPSVVRDVDIPPTGENTPDAAALAAVVEHCAGAAGEVTAAGIVQTFMGTEHESSIASALASTEDQDLSVEQAGSILRDGVARWREQDEQRRLQALTTLPLEELTPEQRELIQNRLGAGRTAAKGSAA